MKLSAYIPVAAIAAAAMLTACDDDTKNVGNRIYDTSALEPSTVLIDGQTEQQELTFTVKMANQSERDETITYGVDANMVANYNAIYGAQAVMLPAANYELRQPVATIIAGAVESSAVSVVVKDINALDRAVVYVLPITVVSSTVGVLDSQRTHYVVVRGAALVNMVCNINENYCYLSDPVAATGLNGMRQVTVQWLMNVDEFGKLISTVMGIEGNFLLRIGDAGVPDNQLQLATSNGNTTDASWQFETGKWTRCTFTYDADARSAALWINGAKKASLTTSYSGSVNWGSANFFVGKSYDNARWLDGCIGEARVWSRILSDEEITGDTQAYFVAPDSEGLVAYWKFNEGAGSQIHDYASGYHLMCSTAPSWISVSLPEE